MRRYGMLLLVLVLAVTSLLAAAAYNSATVTNAGTLTINNTNQALLALVPHNAPTVGAKDNTARVEGGVMVFDFGRGINPSFDDDPGSTPPGTPKLYGLQRNSTYIWGTGASNQGLFAIQNRSADKVQITMKLTGIPAGVDVYVGCTAGWASIPWTQLLNATESGVLFTLASGCTCDVNFKIVVGNAAALGTVTLSLDVKAVAIP